MFYEMIVETGVVKLPVKVYKLPYRFTLHQFKYMQVVLHNFQVKARNRRLLSYVCLLPLYYFFFEFLKIGLWYMFVLKFD